MGRLAELHSMWEARRIGFLVEETMTGSHRLVRESGSPEYPFSFRVVWGNPCLSRFLNPGHEEFLVSELRGSLNAGGFVEQADVEGTLELRYFKDATIRYRFRFADAFGTPHEYLGEKRGLRPWNLHRTHTTCFGTITNLDTGEVVSEGVVRFELKALPSFLWSMRLA